METAALDLGWALTGKVSEADIVWSDASSGPQPLSQPRRTQVESWEKRAVEGQAWQDLLDKSLSVSIATTVAVLEREFHQPHSNYVHPTSDPAHKR